MKWIALLSVLMTPVALADLRAGAATSNITPMLGEPIVGNFVEPVAERVHDELHARCLVLDDGKTRLAFAVCDNVGISREVFDEAKKLLTEKTGLPAANVLMCSTHTHSATSARWRNSLQPGEKLSDYQAFVAHRICDGVRRAMANLEPARIGWGSVDEPRAVFNRRYYVKPGTELLNPFGQTGDKVKMNPGFNNPAVVGPAGPVDPQVSFISVQSRSGRPMALLANYSLHYVGGVRPNEISADYFAVFADKVQQKLGADRLDPPFVGIMTNGTSGDVNNINVMAAQAAMKEPYAQMRKIAEMVADDVVKAHETVKFQDDVKLAAVSAELKLKTRKPTPEMVERAKKIVSGEIKPKGLEGPYATRILDIAASGDEVTIPLQAFGIGELGIDAIPFEVFAQTGLDIKTKSPFKPTFTIELANGSYGYLPTPEQHQLGGYETWLGTNRVEVDASKKIEERVMGLFSELKGK